MPFEAVIWRGLAQIGVFPAQLDSFPIVPLVFDPVVATPPTRKHAQQWEKCPVEQVPLTSATVTVLFDTP